ncbi:hypothetical protein OIU85_024143 [Salix viminalis]|uniref:Uncharacterized protein n=1 Tax=Salix viminalis TaxID=40686 RepID=A0A9Q0U059_SALVM|nr:hypothetical protein OIU85_024143 [Salix viminalis]
MGKSDDIKQEVMAWHGMGFLCLCRQQTSKEEKSAVNLQLSAAYQTESKYCCSIGTEDILGTSSNFSRWKEEKSRRARNFQPQQQQQQNQDSNDGELKRCNWITKNSDKVYVAFHDECWGVPVYDDNQLFELLALSGMLMDYNWTEILKRKEVFREAFNGFDPNIVSKMGEKEIMEIASNKAIMLAESRVRCIVDNSKCIMKIAREFGSFSNYMWGNVNFKPTINRYRYPRNVPLRSPKAEAISKDLLKRGFRFVGPVIVCSFMQAAGLTIDHLVDCFRYSECVSLAERPWRHI